MKQNNETKALMQRKKFIKLKNKLDTQSWLILNMKIAQVIAG